MMVGVRALLPLLEPKPYQTHCLRTFWSMLIGSNGVAFTLYVMSATVVLWWTISIWRRRPEASLAVRYSSLLLATVLIAPHLTVYDLVILAPALLVTADWLVGELRESRRRGLGTILYFVYMLPLIGPLARWTHVQLSVIAMFASVYMMWKISGQSPVAAHRHDLREEKVQL
jgi:hypothetical protein